MPPKALIVTATSGAGHNSVARSLAKGFGQSQNGPVRAEVVDLLGRADSTSIGHINRLYAPIIVDHPGLWGLVYAVSDSTRLWKLAEALLARFWDRPFERFLREHSPDIVLCVHPLCNRVVAHGLRRVDWPAPLVTLITDLGEAHAAWVAPGVRLYAVPTTQVHASLLARGIEERRTLLCGLPVDQRFGQQGIDRRQTRRSLGLEEDTFTVLLTGGGEGAGAMLAAAEAISRARLPVQLIALCGHNETLRQKLAGSLFAVPCRALPFVDDVPELMQAADVVVGKAGALTIGEAIVARRPLIVLRPLPGQERGNADFVRRQELGVVVSEPSGVVETLRLWMANPSVMQRLVASADGHRRQWVDAAARIVAASMQMLGHGGGR